MTTLLRSKLVKARCPHTCIWCGELIDVGDKYLLETVNHEGQLQEQHWHPECKDDCDPYEEFMPGCGERPRLNWRMK
jgi:hypothetical protein